MARHFTLMSSLSFGAATLTSFFLKHVTRRTRPGDCPAGDATCESRRHLSFPSGHAALAFTAASLSCTYHVRVGVYGSRVADYAACGASVGLALATSFLRIRARRHYLSDVLVGSAIGVLAGWLLPSVLYLGLGR